VRAANSTVLMQGSFEGRLNAFKDDGGNTAHYSGTTALQVNHEAPT
jgi:hypothetical protein